MVKAKLKQFLDRLDRNSAAFDPSTLKDEIALKTSWSPANTGGANFGSHRLKQVSDQRIEFRVKKRLMMFAYIFIFCGLGVMALFIGEGMTGDIVMLYIGIPFGGAFLAVGIFLRRYLGRKIIFDKQTGQFQKGHKGHFSEHCLLSDIHAIQLLREYIHSSDDDDNDTSYYSYELNLVLRDASRLNVIDHGNLSDIYYGADVLSAYLNIPVWDAID